MMATVWVPVYLFGLKLKINDQGCTICLNELAGYYPPPLGRLNPPSEGGGFG